MPILGRKDWECFQHFREHVAKLIAATLSSNVPVRLEGIKEQESSAYLQFETGDLRRTLRLNTRHHGPIDFYMRQEIHAEQLKKRDFRLRTRRYWYHLLRPNENDAFLRWEYVSHAHPLGAGTLHCRHHVHLLLPKEAAREFQVGGVPFDLQHVHLPTGWVTIEEMIRFLIHALEVTPLCGDEWDQVLWTAEDRFYQEFTSKRG